ncbi:11333_t:CDS:2, partial [Acaulospora colombiana]
SDSDCVVKDRLFLDLTKEFTVSGWVQLMPVNEGKSAGDILSIESPSFPSPIFSIWVEFPASTVHFSCMQAGNDTIKIVKTGVTAPKTTFHLAIEYDLGAFTVYVNGEKCKTIPEACPLPNPDHVCLFLQEARSSFNLQISGIKIYSESLDEVRNDVLLMNRALKFTTEGRRQGHFRGVAGNTGHKH